MRLNFLKILLMELFFDGYKHADYKPGDRIAAVGVGGLVAGSLGVKALAKTGILAKLLKFWWILLAPLAFLGKFLSGKESSPNTSSPSVKRRRRKNKMYFLYLLAAILPAAVLVLYAYKQDQFPEPPRIVFKTFFLDALLFTSNRFSYTC